MPSMIQIGTDGKYEGVVDGVVVIRSKNEGRVRYVLKSQYRQAKPEMNLVRQQEQLIQMPKSEFPINERFAFLEHFVRMVARRKSNSLVITGPGGLGKTHTVVETLKACGKVEDTIGSEDGDYLMVKGFSTAKALFRTLWENNSKLIIYDDCDAVLTDPVAVNILKGALDSSDKRVISWNAEFRDTEEMPNRFEFTGRVIFISNRSMDRIPQALISRSMRVSLDMTTDEKVERLEAIIHNDNFMPHLERSVKQDAMDFIKSIASKCTDLNIRTAQQLAQLRDDTEDMALFCRTAAYMCLS